MKKSNTKKNKTLKKREWKNMKPHSNKSRINMKNKYGNKCFLEPRRMKYPICSKFTGKQECMGLRAADYYLNINIGKSQKLLKRQDKTSKKKNKEITRKLKKYLKIKKKSDTLKNKVC